MFAVLKPDNETTLPQASGGPCPGFQAHQPGDCLPISRAPPVLRLPFPARQGSCPGFLNHPPQKHFVLRFFFFFKLAIKTWNYFFLFEIHFQSSFIDLSFIQWLENFLKSDIIYEPLLFGIMSFCTLQ